MHALAALLISTDAGDRVQAMRCITVIVFLTVSIHACGSGFDPWTFGMSKEEVAAIEKFGPYSYVKKTGGLETANGVFAGKKLNISFVFDDQGLYIIQVWFYEGGSLDEAATSWQELYLNLENEFGELVVPKIHVTGDSQPVPLALLTSVVKQHVDTIGTIKMEPKIMPIDKVVFSPFLKYPAKELPYYYVFLYYARP